MDDYGSKLKYTQNENVFEVEEIFTNILLRLPVKSLLICKSVCKYWWSLICSRSFMNLHLIQSQENPTYVFHRYTLRGGNIHLLTKADGETTESFLPGCPGFYSKGMICSFNGLICCIDIQTHFLRKWIQRRTPDTHIYNPVIGKGLRRSTLDILIGVSFGPTLNEYKVFQFYYRDEQLYECKVYSSIVGSWKSMGTVPYSPYTSSNHVCINETVFWFSLSMIDGRLVGHILAVDREENFSTIRIPEEETMRPFLVNLEGCLCLVARHGLGQLDIWALQDSKESVWMKKWSDNIPQNFNIQGLSYVTVQKNEILLANWVRSVFYNMETRTWREFNWEHAHEDKFSLPMAYTESLLPCKY
ncbi:hypothetical protein AAG906_011907 [Vitis piasezkii]